MTKNDVPISVEGRAFMREFSVCVDTCLNAAQDDSDPDVIGRISRAVGHLALLAETARPQWVKLAWTLAGEKAVAACNESEWVPASDKQVIYGKLSLKTAVLQRLFSSALLSALPEAQEGLAEGVSGRRFFYDEGVDLVVKSPQSGQEREQVGTQKLEARERQAAKLRKLTQEAHVEIKEQIKAVNSLSEAWGVNNGSASQKSQYYAREAQNITNRVAGGKTSQNALPEALEAMALAAFKAVSIQPTNEALSVAKSAINLFANCLKTWNPKNGSYKARTALHCLAGATAVHPELGGDLALAFDSGLADLVARDPQWHAEAIALAVWWKSLPDSAGPVPGIASAALASMPVAVIELIPDASGSVEPELNLAIAGQACLESLRALSSGDADWRDSQATIVAARKLAVGIDAGSVAAIFFARECAPLYRGAAVGLARTAEASELERFDQELSTKPQLGWRLMNKSETLGLDEGPTLVDDLRAAAGTLGWSGPVADRTLATLTAARAEIRARAERIALRNELEVMPFSIKSRHRI